MATEKEMKDGAFQKIYYLYRWILCPIRSHASITSELINQYKIASKINFSTFQNLKKDYNKIALNNKTKMEILDNIKYLDENLYKTKFNYIDEINNNHEIRIYATKEMLNNLNNANIEQYFMDGTYKIVPNFGNFKTMVTLLVYNKEINAFVQCCYTLLTDETENIYEKFLHLLKFNYNFISKYLTIDFSKSEENAIKQIYENETKIIFCFFHFVQCLWRRINKIDLRKKEYIKVSKSLIFIIKLFAFINIDKIEDSYNCIKNSELFKGEKYKEYFHILIEIG